jgi:PAS domain S-box-containing protein
MEPSESREPNKLRTVGILIFDDVEVLDFCGPYEVFCLACPEGSTDDDSRLFDVVTIAEEERPVRCIGGLQVLPQYTFDDHPPLDILVIPGGDGARRELHNRRLLDWIAAREPCTEITSSVCIGAFLLAECGILDGLPATTLWYRVDWMRGRYPAVEMLDHVRLVDTGHVVTSAGISAGIDMALHVVERLHGEGTAAWTARLMEHLWSEQYRSVFESSADAIVITDRSGRIAETNSAACTLFGYSRDEMIGRHAATLVPPELHDDVTAYVRAVSRAGSAEVRSVGQRRNESRFQAEIRGTPFEYHGMPHVLWMIRDITARIEAEEAVKKERLRLSRELHDSVSQALYSITLGARTARAMADADPAGLAGPLDFVLEQAERGLAEMRALIFELRPEALEQEGLVAAMTRHAAALEAQHGLRLDLALCTEPAAPLAVKEALYRITQEAMHNTVKHAQATEIRLTLEGTAETVTLEIRDNGVGFDPAGSFLGHFGLKSMRERASHLGGTLEMESAVGAGTSLTVRIPFEAGTTVSSFAPSQGRIGP